MKLKLHGNEYEVTPIRAEYSANGSLAVMLEETETGESFAVITVNLMYPLDKDKAFVDTNNCPWAEDFLVKNKLAKPCGVMAPSGFCTYPLYKFNLNKIKRVQ